MTRADLFPHGDDPHCTCRKCWAAKCEAENIVFPENQRFIVCEFCGNKRCPHATDHNLDCTNSNEPGQKGSAYE